jgi:hypothetical protein
MAGATAVAVMVMESSLVALPALLAALTVNVETAAAVGVPEMIPVAAARVKPAGSVSISMLQVIGAVPVASRVAVYGVLSTPPSNDVVVMTGEPAAAAAMVMESCLVALSALLAALTVNVELPAVVGMPEITPVAAARVKPAGSEPVSMLQVIGFALVAARVALYATPTVPFANDVVVMAGAVAPPPPASAPPPEQAANNRPIRAAAVKTTVSLVFIFIKTSLKIYKTLHLTGAFQGFIR